MSKKRVKEVKKVTDINMAYIINFLGTAEPEDVKVMLDMRERYIKEEAEAIRHDNPSLSDAAVTAKANRQYFAAFRAEFARRYHPELLAEPKPKEKKDAFIAACEKRLAEIGAV